MQPRLGSNEGDPVDPRSDAPAAKGGPGGPGVVAVAGEALIDFVPAGRNGLFEAAPGGSPANVAVGLARQEVPVRLLARIADDLLGHRIRAHLTGNRVDLSFAVQAAEPTSLAIVDVGPDGVVEYDFRVKGTADWQWRDHELAAALDGDVVALHAGSLALTMAPGADALQRLMARAGEAMTVSYDPNCRPLLMGSPEAVRGRIETLVGLADVVKASADDLAWLLPGRAPEQVAESWLAKGPSVVVVTLGPAGLVVAARQAGVMRRPGRSVTVVDTVGAGDACMSALLAGLHRRDLLGASRRADLLAVDAATLQDVADEAVLAAAITCTRHGADPPTSADLRTALA
jgi:fructokinase